MLTRIYFALFIFMGLATPTKADILILMDGREFRGELDRRATIHMNPLSLKTITILLEKSGSRESKLRTFDSIDVQRIILEMPAARQVIDLAALREQVFDSPFAKAGESSPDAEDLDDGNPNASHDDMPWVLSPSGERHNSGRALVVAGSVLAGVGVVAAAATGEPATAIAVGGGLGLIVYGSQKSRGQRTKTFEYGLTPKRRAYLGVSWRW